ncbi:MAG: hypothetical protein QS721_05065 [Candidatus Endonucleobacter sp. (ex Gigantidas childressi)]|nr:hypothetical protein [Candidatus Endonucleobacter sp. (ex Gigantidas childressi)]
MDDIKTIITIEITMNNNVIQCGSKNRVCICVTLFIEDRCVLVEKQLEIFREGLA